MAGVIPAELLVKPFQVLLAAALDRDGVGHGDLMMAGSKASTRSALLAK